MDTRRLLQLRAGDVNLLFARIGMATSDDRELIKIFRFYRAMLVTDDVLQTNVFRLRVPTFSTWCAINDLSNISCICRRMIVWSTIWSHSWLLWTAFIGLCICWLLWTAFIGLCSWTSNRISMSSSFPTTCYDFVTLHLRYDQTVSLADIRHRVAICIHHRINIIIIFFGFGLGGDWFLQLYTERCYFGGTVGLGVVL